MVNDKFKNLGGGATLLTARGAGFGGFVDMIGEFDKCIKLNYNSVMKNYSLIKEIINNKTVCEAHSKHNPYYTRSKKAAFTLAEVLITLGIIGVVAAMTIPTLIANYQEKQTITRLQKAYATLKNAFEMAKVEHGDYNTWSWTQYPTSNGERTQYFMENYIFPYLKVSNVCFSDSCGTAIKRPDGNTVYASSSRGAFVLNDGTLVYCWAGGDDYYPHVWFFVDVNGSSEPNILGKDVFAMYFSPGNPGKAAGNTNDDGDFEDSGKTFNIGYGLRFFGEGSGFTAEEMMQPNFVIEDRPGAFSAVACNVEGGDGRICGAVIQLSGWKFPDGYLK